MKAAIIREFKHPLLVEDVEDPIPGPEDVLIKVEACAVCHSDLHIAEADWPHPQRIINQPLIPGHEVDGEVVAKGTAVTNLELGDRVGVAWVHWTCGSCELCNEGRENLCTRQIITGAMVDGGVAEVIPAKASHALKRPGALSSDEAPPPFFPGVTVYRALRNTRGTAGER